MINNSPVCLSHTAAAKSAPGTARPVQRRMPLRRAFDLRIWSREQVPDTLRRACSVSLHGCILHVCGSLASTHRVVCFKCRDSLSRLSAPRPTGAGPHRRTFGRMMRVLTRGASFQCHRNV